MNMEMAFQILVTVAINLIIAAYVFGKLSEKVKNITENLNLMLKNCKENRQEFVPASVISLKLEHIIEMINLTKSDIEKIFNKLEEK